MRAGRMPTQMPYANRERLRRGSGSDRSPDRSRDRLGLALAVEQIVEQAVKGHLRVFEFLECDVEHLERKL